MPNSHGDIEMTTKPSSDEDNNKSVAHTQKKVQEKEEEEDDRPPTPPKRDFKTKEKGTVDEPEGKRKRILSFPRPEVIYKPENPENLMSCLKTTVILLNLLIWVSGISVFCRVVMNEVTYSELPIIHRERRIDNRG